MDNVCASYQKQAKRKKEKPMANKFENVGQSFSQITSRRGIFKWMGQIAAGASIAGIGLNIANPLTAQAESNQPTIGYRADKYGNPDQPNCIPCSGCSVVSCAPNGNCRAGNQQAPILVHYHQYYGCIAPGGTCPYNNLYMCASTCSC